MKLPSPATWTHVVSVGIIWIFAISPPLHAQNWSIQSGINTTSYQFTTSSGTQLAALRPSPGRYSALSYQKVLLDTAKLLLKTNRSAVYFANHSTQAKLVSMLRLGFQLSSEQLNTSGSASISQFAYQTEFAGIGIQAGLQIPIRKKLSIEVAGKLNSQYLIQGTQRIDSQEFDLLQDPQFNGIQLLAGYVGQVNYRINTYAALHLGFQSLQSIGVSPVNSTELAFQPATVFVGIRLFPN
jgi:hypothetical protein